MDHLGSDVNSTGREYAPVAVKDLDYVIFTGTERASFEDMKDQYEANEDIMITRYDLASQSWQKPIKPDGKVLPNGINTAFHESSITMANSNKFYFNRLNNLFSWDGTNEPQPEMVPTGDLDPDDIIGIYISKDEKYRFLVTDMFDLGKGGRDIFVSTKSGDSWSDWSALDAINTTADEDSPFVDKDGNLYYSLNGEGSMGGHDIFKAPKSGNSWGKGVNVGIPVNSTGDDIHYYPLGDGKIGYVASNRQGGEGAFDLYRVWTCEDIQKTTINGRLLAEGKPVKAELFLKDADGNSIGSGKTDDKTGSYSLNVKPGMSYNVEIAAENYMNHDFAFSVPKQCKDYNLYQEIDIDMKKDNEGNVAAQTASLANAFYDIDDHRGEQSPGDFIAGLPDGHPLKPETQSSEVEMDVTKPIKLLAEQFKDVRFGYDSDAVSGSAETIIDKVADYLNKTSQASVVLQGHTDSKGAAWYNKALSKRRANSVAKALRKKGVDKSRIRVEHYGEEKLIKPDHDADGNYLPEEAQKNRRVEIEVVLPDAEDASSGN